MAKNEVIKKWYKSRTVWVNILGGLALVLQNQFGFPVSGEVQAAVLIILNTYLRFDTSSKIGK